MGDVPVLFVESASAGFGENLATDLVALFPESRSATSFQVRLQFDPSLIAFRKVTWPGALAGGTARLDGDNVLTIESEGGIGCAPASSCHVATIFWSGRAPGESAVQVLEVAAWDGAIRIPSVDSADGTARIVSVQDDPVRGDSDLGGGNAIVLVGLVALLCGALAAPFFFAARRLAGRRSGTAADPSTVYSSDEMAEFVVRYLDNIQSAGLVDEPLRDVDGMARANAMRGH